MYVIFPYIANGRYPFQGGVTLEEGNSVYSAQAFSSIREYSPEA